MDMLERLWKHAGSVAVGICGVLVAVATFVTVQNLEQTKVRSTFEESVNRQHTSLQRIIRHAEHQIRSLQTFFYSSIEVTEAELDRFSASITSNNELAWDGLYWCPAISSENNDTDGADDRRSGDRTISTESQDPVSFPVRYRAEPDSSTFQRGVNLLDHVEPQSRVWDVLKSGAQLAVMPETQGTKGEASRVAWILTPVFEQPDGEEQRVFEGVIAGKLNLSETLQPVVSGSARKLRVHLLPNRSTELRVSSVQTDGRDNGIIRWYQHLFYGTFRKKKKLSFGDSSWNVTYTPAPSIFQVRVLDPWIAPVAAFMMLALSGVIGLYLHRINSRKQVIEQTVERRTRELEEARRREEKANRAKSEFLARMSHELRTPLNALMGMNELLEKGSLSPEQQEYIRISQNSAETLLRMINNILDLSHVKSGELELNRETMELEPFVQDAVSYHAREASKSGVELYVFVEGECPALIYEDRQRLRQILVNLVGNAVKYKDQDEFLFRVLCETVDNEPRMLRFQVSDTGIEMSEKKQDQLFETFTQVDTSGSQQYGGNGFGLSICSSLVEHMGGEIEVASEEGEGSTFSFWIPVRRPENEQSGTGNVQRIQDRYAPGRTVDRVLVADSSSIGQMILERMLTAFGMHVECVSNGSDAVKTVRNEREQGRSFDLVTVDWELNDMDGLQMVREINGIVPPQRVILMVTADQLGDVQEEMDKIGVGSPLVKPVGWSKLKQAINGLRSREDPEASPKQEPGSTRSVQLQKDGGPSVLVAEDNEHNRKLIGALLDSHPVALAFAVDGEEALKKARSGEYNLILMDIRMPAMDGMEVTRSVRKWERERGREQTPIVALTAHALSEQEKKCREAGCNAYLTKPICEDELLETIQSLLSDPDQQQSKDPNGKDPSHNSDGQNLQHVKRQYRDLVPELLTDLRQKLKQVQDAARQKEYGRVERIAHDVRGVSANFGFQHLSNRVERIVDLAREPGDPKRMEEIAQELRSYLDDVKIRFE